MVHMCDTADDAFKHLKEFWMKCEADGEVPSGLSTKTLKPPEAPPAKRLKLTGDADSLERPNPPKAYKNLDYINSHACRVFRIQCEFEETRHRLEAHGIQNTLFFA